VVKDNEKVGAVMVVGAGIAGIQASLDLANSGMKVYLVESGISIRGVMAQLDKTFPTNDCSACILSPKLVEVGRHPNVTIKTRRTVEAVEGEPGKFKVKLTSAPGTSTWTNARAAAIAPKSAPSRSKRNSTAI